MEATTIPASSEPCDQSHLEPEGTAEAEEVEEVEETEEPEEVEQPQFQSCRICGDLNPWHPDTAGLFGPTYKSGKQQFVIRTEAASILAASEAGCLECSMLKKGLEEYTKLKENEGSCMVKIVVGDVPRWRGVQVGLKGKDRVEFYAPPLKESIFPAVGYMRPLAFDSSEGVVDIKFFLGDCMKEHSECCPQGPFVLPKRVLDVGSEDKEPSLYVTMGEKEPYLVLSHCWGTSQQCKTTTANLAEHQTVIRLSTLSKTYQDFISIARQMEIRFVWIDSLCILQDDKADWEQEAARMGFYYRDALFTVAAAHAADGNGGLFSARPDRSRGMNFGFKDKDGNEHLAAWIRKPILSHSIYFYGFHLENKSDYPLETRAWCFQERILSTRIVHFTKDELVWECNGGTSCECGEIRPGEHERSLRDRFRTVLTAQSIQDRTTAWMEMITACSQRNLTYESDRLPTLSSLARGLQEKGFGEYLAGLWLNELPRQLLWMVGDHTKAKRVLAYRAPSWSFASIEGSAIRDSFSAPLKGIKMLGMPAGKLKLDTINPWTTHIKVLAHDCESAGHDHTGNLSKAFIRISGPGQNAAMWWEFEAFRDTKRMRYFVQSLERRYSFVPDYPLFGEPCYTALEEVPASSVTENDGQLSPEDAAKRKRLQPMEGDESGGENPIARVPVIIVAVCTEQIRMFGSGQVLHCLVLKESREGEGLFERVGILKLQQGGDKWLEVAEEMTLTLV